MIGNELLDDPRADPVAVGKELHDIARLNALFWGTKAVVDALDTVFRAARDAGCEMRDARWTLLDIGTGAGDIPRAAVAAASRYGITLSPIGVEVIPAAARLARSSGVAAVSHRGILVTRRQGPVKLTDAKPQAVSSQRFQWCRTYVLQPTTACGVASGDCPVD